MRDAAATAEEEELDAIRALFSLFAKRENKKRLTALLPLWSSSDMRERERENAPRKERKKECERAERTRQENEKSLRVK